MLNFKFKLSTWFTVKICDLKIDNIVKTPHQILRKTVLRVFTTLTNVSVIFKF